MLHDNYTYLLHSICQPVDNDLWGYGQKPTLVRLARIKNYSQKCRKLFPWRVVHFAPHITQTLPLVFHHLFRFILIYPVPNSFFHSSGLKNSKLNPLTEPPNSHLPSPYFPSRVLDQVSLSQATCAFPSLTPETSAFFPHYPPRSSNPPQLTASVSASASSARGAAQVEDIFLSFYSKKTHPPLQSHHSSLISFRTPPHHPLHLFKGLHGTACKKPGFVPAG